MIDSRYAATKLYLEKSWPLTRKVTLLFIIPSLSWFITWLLKDYIESTASINALFLLFTAAGWWISEAIPPFAVSLFIIGFSIYFLEDISPTVLSQDWEKYTNTWSNPIIWILLGGFFLAAGAKLTHLDKIFTERVLSRFGTNPSRLLFVVMMLTAIFSMFISNTSSTEMMFIIIAPVLRSFHKDEPLLKAFALGIPAAATVGGMGTIIGSAPNAIAAGTIQAAGLSFDFVEWMSIGVPLAIIFTIGLWWLLTNRFKTQLTQINVVSKINNETENLTKISNESRWIVFGTFILTIFLWITKPIHEIPVAAVSFIPIVVFAVTGIVRSEDIKLIPWDTLILIAGGLTLGVVIHDSGLAHQVSEWIPEIGYRYVIFLLLGYMASILSNIMSNTAATSVLIPMGMTILPDSCIAVVLTIGFSASTSLILPISTPPNAIAYATGYLEQKDFRYIGIISGIFAPFIIASVIYFMF